MKQKEESSEPDSVAVQKTPNNQPASKPLVWMAKKVKITGHDLVYHDYSMKNDWEYAIKSLQVEGSNIATNGRNAVKVKATLTSDAQLNADFVGGLDVANQDTRLDMKLKGVQLSDFDALCRNYTGYPLNGGYLSLDSRIDMLGGKTIGSNKIVIDHPNVGKKERFTKAPYKNIPVRLGFQLLTSAQDIIVVDVPLTGDVTNPKFSLRKVISRALLKVFFGPLMGVNDRNKSVNEAELREMQELLGEDSVLLGNDSVSNLATDVTVTAGDSSRLAEVSE
jgi:hypothetical protein